MVWTYNHQQNKVRHLNFAPPPSHPNSMLQLQNQSLRAQRQSHSQVQDWDVEGEFLSQFLLLIVWICKKNLKRGSPYVFTKFFWRTSQIAAEIVRNNTDLLSTHMAIRHLEFCTFVIFHFRAFYMRSKQKKAAKFKF